MKPKFKAIGSSVVAIALTLAIGAPAHAATLTYIFSGTASGTLDGTSFTNATFNIDFVGGTVTGPFGGEYYDSGATGSITIGSLSDTLPGYTVVNNTDPSFPRIGFFDAAVNADALQNTAFDTYNLQTTFPLTSGTSEYDTVDSFTTGNGTFDFTSVSNTTFEAVSGVPEISTWAMMLIGFGLVGLQLRRRGTVLAT
jgi:hypothetical protein